MKKQYDDISKALLKRANTLREDRHKGNANIVRDTAEFVLLELSLVFLNLAAKEKE